eukprot:Partr_v1_DN26558_c0_g1_i1_m3313 putative GTPase activating protein (SH3 domain) binding protein
MTSADATATPAPIANGQPQKLASSSTSQPPAHPMQHPMPSTRRLEPMEVGWQFVQEYYTILNKDPNRLHCFYNKPSSMVHGVEGETVRACHGQQEIHKRFADLNLQYGKVVVSCVDSMATLNSGIVVSVIGEMETVGKQSRKFTQCFVLAEQPNGYFVLNDIFRYLKDPYDDEVHAASASEVEVTDEEEVAVVEKVKELSVASASVPVEKAAEQVKIAEPPLAEREQPAVVLHEARNPSPVRSEKSSIAPAVRSDIPEPSSSVPADHSQNKQQPEQPEQVNAPKSWAKMAESGKDLWNAHKSEAKGQAVPVQSRPAGGRSSSSVGSSHTAAASKPSEHHRSSGDRGGSDRQANVDHAVQIRGFSKATKVAHIKEAFAQAVGLTKWVDLISESSALVEFHDVETARKALALKSIIVNGEATTIEERRNTGSRGGDRRPRRQAGKSTASASSSSAHLNHPSMVSNASHQSINSGRTSGNKSVSRK